MLDQQQADALLPIEGSGSRMHPQRHVTLPADDADHVIAASDLSLADRETWGEFWSNLLVEYEYVCQEMAEAA